MIRFCTYFDSNFLVRGVTLVRSILKHIDDCEIWILCLDRVTAQGIRSLGLRQLRPVELSALEQHDPDLSAASRGRSIIEYYFTLTPSWCQYVMQQASEDDIVCYVDADVMFFQSPSGALEELGDGSILIMPHRFPAGSSAAERAGLYNVGLIAFRNDATSRQCVARWRRQCLDWCSDVAAHGKYADQKYLDDWPQRYAGVVISTRLGSCLAPWNVSQYRVAVSGRGFLINGQPLTFYHFHGLTVFSAWLYDSGVREYGNLSPQTERALYGSYLRELRATALDLRHNGCNAPLRDWIWRRRRRSLPALLRKLANARIVAS